MKSVPLGLHDLTATQILDDVNAALRLMQEDSEWFPLQTELLIPYKTYAVWRLVYLRRMRSMLHASRLRKPRRYRALLRRRP